MRRAPVLLHVRERSGIMACRGAAGEGEHIMHDKGYYHSLKEHTRDPTRPTTRQPSFYLPKHPPECRPCPPSCDVGETYLWGVRRDLGLAVLGKEIIQRLGEQILNSRVMLGREKTQLPFDLRWKVGSDVAFPFPSRPKMKSPGFGRRGKIGWRLLRTRVARRSRWPRAAKHGLP